MQTMRYEINVSLNGNHLFATHKRSVINEEQLKLVHGTFMRKFPVKEGYLVSVTQWIENGYKIEAVLNY